MKRQNPPGSLYDRLPGGTGYEERGVTHENRLRWLFRLFQNHKRHECFFMKIALQVRVHIYRLRVHL